MLTTPEWVKHSIFYQIFPDRFARIPQPGDEFLNLQAWDSPPTRKGFKGGNLNGVIDKLDYLTELGINAIYFNPIFTSSANHRYHTYDYFNVDPLLGGNKTFKTLLDEAHRRGIRIVLDGVFNHASRGFFQFNHTLENKENSPFVDWFHFDEDRLTGKKPWSVYQDVTWNNEMSKGENSIRNYGYQAWWDLPALPKFNTNAPAVREFIYDVAEYWIKFGIDGWRLDVPEEIDDEGFWQEFRRRVKAINPEAYIVGEIWHEAKRWLQGDQFDAVMNYPITTAALMFFAHSKINPESDSSMGDYQTEFQKLDGISFSQRLEEIFSWYETEINQVQLNLLESHDTPRLITYVNGDQNSLMLAALLMFTIPGAPTIYYGSEVGLDGKGDPDCRKAFPWDEKHWNKDLLTFFKSCIKLRQDYPALRTGDFRTLYADRISFVFERELAGEKIIVAFNAGEESTIIKLPYTSGKLVFGQADLSIGDGKLEIRINPRTGIVIEG